MNHRTRIFAWSAITLAIPVGALALAIRAEAQSVAPPAQTARANTTTTTRATTHETVAKVFVLPEEACTDPDSQRCYGTRHDFTITLPPRPEFAAAKAAVDAANATMKGLSDKTKALEQERATLAVQAKALSDNLASLRADAEATKAPDADAATKQRHATDLAKIADVEREATKVAESIAKKEAEIAATVKALAEASASVDAARKKLVVAGAPADVALTGSGFAFASTIPLGESVATQYYGSLGWDAARRLPSACRLPDAFALAKTSNLLNVFPTQGPFFCDPLHVVPGEVVADAGDHTLQSQVYVIDNRGTWQQSVSVKNPSGAREVAKASFKIAVTSYSRVDGGGLTISGYVQSSGQTPGQGQFRSYAFSYASVKVTGGADVARMGIDWAPRMTTGAGGTQAIAWDPVSLHVMGSTGREKRREDLLTAVLRTKGAGTATHWRGDGEFSIDANEASFEVRMPSTLTSQRGELKLAVQNGAVTQRTASGALGTHRLPTLGTATRVAPTSSTKRALPTQSSKVIKLDFAVPKLQAGEKFELRLGGGGADEG